MLAHLKIDQTEAAGCYSDTGLYCAASSSAVKVSTGPRARAHRVKPTTRHDAFWPSIGGRYHLQCRLQIRSTPTCARDRCLVTHGLLVQVLNWNLKMAARSPSCTTFCRSHNVSPNVTNVIFRTFSRPFGVVKWSKQKSQNIGLYFCLVILTLRCRCGLLNV